jgi:hypothetical protein
MFNQLLSLINQKPHSEAEGRAAFLQRVLEGTTELSEEDWAKLPGEVQKWVNDATQAFNTDQPIPDPEAVVGEKVAAAPAQPVAASEQPAAPPAPAQPAAPAKEPRKPGAIQVFCSRLIAQPTVTRKDLLAAMVAEGYTISPSTTSVCEGDVRRLLTILRENNYLQGDILNHRLSQPKATK